MRLPSTLLDFQTQFPDDDHCWSYLRRALGAGRAAPPRGPEGVDITPHTRTLSQNAAWMPYPLPYPPWTGCMVSKTMTRF